MGELKPHCCTKAVYSAFQQLKRGRMKPYCLSRKGVANWNYTDAVLSVYSTIQQLKRWRVYCYVHEAMNCKSACLPHPLGGYRSFSVAIKIHKGSLEGKGQRLWGRDEPWVISPRWLIFLSAPYNFTCVITSDYQWGKVVRILGNTLSTVMRSTNCQNGAPEWFAYN